MQFKQVISHWCPVCQSQTKHVDRAEHNQPWFLLLMLVLTAGAYLLLLPLIWAFGSRHWTCDWCGTVTKTKFGKRPDLEPTAQRPTGGYDPKRLPDRLPDFEAEGGKLPPPPRRRPPPLPGKRA